MKKPDRFERMATTTIVGARGAYQAVDLQTRDALRRQYRALLRVIRKQQKLFEKSGRLYASSHDKLSNEMYWRADGAVDGCNDILAAMKRWGT